MPSHPIATWITPCNSRNVQVLGTSTRRHTIGLIPSSQTLTCTISAASALAADEAVSMTGLVRFGARVTRPAYRRSPFPVAGTPDILMLSVETIVNTILGTITTALACGDRVELRDFGVFAVKTREARTGRNPRNGVEIAVSEKVVPTFKTSRDMHRRLNPAEG